MRRQLIGAVRRSRATILHRRLARTLRRDRFDADDDRSEPTRDRHGGPGRAGRRRRRAGLVTVAVAAAVVLAGCGGGAGGGGGSYGGNGGSGSIGLAVGGAQDAEAFRDNVESGYVPQPTDMTYEGLYHDYYFDTGRAQACEARFCPSYSRAVSPDPLSGEPEPYLTVGLNSGISAEEFGRPPLDLVVVVDVSGSMGEGMRSYYYDAGNDSGENPETTAKMAAARDAVRTLVGELRPGDRIGIVAFDGRAEVVHGMTAIGEGDRASLNGSIGELRADGSTNLDAGLRTARIMLEPHADGPGGDREQRIVVATDAMPNTGETGSGSFEGRLGDLADDGIHATFLGVGIDFNSRLVEAITATRGANYYTVGSAEEFRDRMGEEFSHMVTPIVYDLSVTVDSERFEIEEVYGSPSAEASTGQVLHVTTLFPSRKREGKTEGGVILVGLERTGGDEPIAGRLNLTASYETPRGEERSTTRTVSFDDIERGSYDTSGARKAIALTRYADLLRNWATYERAQAAGAEPEPPAPEIRSHSELGRWEQRSVDLRVSPIYRDRLERFADYFAAEQRALGDETMLEDLAIVERLAEHGGNESTAADPDRGTPVGGNDSRASAESGSTRAAA